MTIYEKLKKIFFYKKFLREGVRAWSSKSSLPYIDYRQGHPLTCLGLRVPFICLIA